MSKDGWRAVLGTVVGVILTTVFSLLILGGAALLSFGSAHFFIAKGDVLGGFICLGALFFLALEAIDLWHGDIE